MGHYIVVEMSRKSEKKVTLSKFADKLSWGK